jgi:ribonuclease P protein component
MDSTAPLRGTNETNVPTKQPETQKDSRLSSAHEQPRRSPGAEAQAGQGPQAADRQYSTETATLKAAPRGQQLPRAARIRKRREFVKLQRISRRGAGMRFVVITAAETTGTSRIGITVSRRVGGAVVRNRVKRLVREFFRRYRHRIMPAQDVLVIARQGAATATYAEVKRELAGALKIDVEK